MPEPIYLDEQVISLDDEEEDDDFTPEELGLTSLGAVPTADELEEERAMLTAPREPMADTGQPFQRDTAMEERLNAITPGAPRTSAPPSARLDPALLRRVLDRTPRGAPAEGARGLNAPAQREDVVHGTPPATPDGPSEADLYRRALDASRSNRNRNAIIGLIAALASRGRAKASDIAGLQANSDLPLREYQAARGMRDAERTRQERAAQQTRAESRQSRQDEIAERRLALQEQQGQQRFDLQSQQLERRAGLDEQTSALRAAQLQNLQGDVEAESAMRATDNAPARVAQARVRAVNERLRLGLSDEDISQLSAQQADQIVRETMRDTRRGAGGGRGTGNGTGLTNPDVGVPRQQWGSGADPLVGAYLEAFPDADPDVVRMQAAQSGSSSRTGRNALLAQLNSANRMQGQTRWTQERRGRIPGWERDEATAPQLNDTAFNRVRNIALADQEFNSVLGQLEEDLAGIGLGDRVSERLGQGSGRAQRVEHALDVIRNQLRQVNDMGMSEAAQEEMRHAIPGLSANVTAGAILRNARAAYAVKHRYVQAALQQAGYRSAGGGGHGGGAVRSPDGRTLVRVGGRSFLATEEQLQAMRRDGVDFEEGQ
jgi:hypothetical protein